MNEKIYLIVECNELSDGWECDADRKPLGMVHDISFLQRINGYEIYELKADGKFELIKHYEDGDLRIRWNNFSNTYYLIDENNSFIRNIGQTEITILKP
jgi:hypothetical protein